MTARLSADHRRAYESVPAPTIVSDAESRAVVWTNSAANDLFGYTTDEFLSGVSMDDITHPYFRTDLELNYAAIHSQLGLVTFKRFLCADQSSFLGEIRASVHPAINSLVVAVVTDVESSDRLRVELSRSASTDALTGLLRREAFMSAAQLLTAGGCPYALIFVDLDDFKIVNDEYGHAAGDEILSRTGARIKASFREDDLACRFGGDEFVMFMNRVTDTLVISRVVKGLIDNINQPVVIEDKAAVITPFASVGVALVDANCPLDLAINEADSAMYKIKRQPDSVRREKSAAVVRVTHDAERAYVETICSSQLPGLFVPSAREAVDQTSNL